MAITGIVAVARNNAIGRGGKLPWHYSADLRHFKQTTLGGAILMGMTTWRSIGRPLPGRLNLVLSRSPRSEIGEDLIFVKSKQEALSISRYLRTDLFVIGGSVVFSLFQDEIDTWIVTRIPETVANADVFMPDDFLNGFTLEETRELDEGLAVEIFRRNAVLG